MIDNPCMTLYKLKGQERYLRAYHNYIIDKLRLEYRRTNRTVYGNTRCIVETKHTIPDYQGKILSLNSKSNYKSFKKLYNKKKGEYTFTELTEQTPFTSGWKQIIKQLDLPITFSYVSFGNVNGTNTGWYTENEKDNRSTLILIKQEIPGLVNFDVGGMYELKTVLKELEKLDGDSDGKIHVAISRRIGAALNKDRQLYFDGFVDTKQYFTLFERFDEDKYDIISRLEKESETHESTV